MITPWQSTNQLTYLVNVDNKLFCTCLDFETRLQPCKHIYAVELIIQREERADGTTIATKTCRLSYGQNWAAYNAAQQKEQELFATLLRDLCDTVLHKKCFLIRFFVQMCSKVGADLIWMRLVESVSIVTYRVSFCA